MPKDKDSITIISHERHEFRSKNESFSKQEVKLEDTPLFFPPGLEKLFLLFYIIILPYIAGLIFSFVYLSKSNYELFAQLNESTPIFLTWCIGYEIIAGIILLYIVKMAITFTVTQNSGGINGKKKKRKFKRPS